MKSSGSGYQALVSEPQSRKDFKPLEPLFTSCDGYKTHWLLSLLQIVAIALTCGFFGLALLWSPKARKIFKLPCQDCDAEVFFIVSNEGHLFISWVEQADNGMRWFDYQCKRFILDQKTLLYYPAPETCLGWTYKNIRDMQPGLTSAHFQDPETQIFEGKNIISVPMNPVTLDLAVELFGPVYVYQYFCVLLWLVNDYVIFACIIFVSMMISGLFDVYTTRKNKFKIQAMAAYETPTTVRRNGSFSIIPSVDLLPGDVIALPSTSDWKVPCDLVLLTADLIGIAVIDESSLTGESLPVVKMALSGDPNQKYNPEKDKKTSIYSGTILSRASPARGDDHVLAVVTRIGFNTTKGGLIRSILNAPPVQYSYQTQAHIFLAGMLVVGAFFFILTLYLWGIFEAGADLTNVKTWLFGFESIAVLIPPTLPLVFHVGLLFAAKNLEEHEVFTTNPTCIPISGKTNMMCFDKTGTLTKSDLDVIGVVPVESLDNTSFVAVDLETSGTDGDCLVPLDQLDPIDAKRKRHTFEEKGPCSFGQIHQVSNIDRKAALFRGLATCHELSDFSDGFEASSLSGPTLDRKMFGATECNYQNGDCYPIISDRGHRRYEILRRFDFDHTLQRMTSIVRDLATGSCYVISKGSPEMIAEVCLPQMPKDYKNQSRSYAADGCYVIAHKPFDFQMNQLPLLKRADLEKQLQLDGLLLIRNELKEDSAATIAALKLGNVNIRILTGDNVYTAFYIAKQCGIIYPNQSCFIGNIEEKKIVWRSLSDPEVTLNIDKMLCSKESNRFALGVDAPTYEMLAKAGETELLLNHIKIFARMKPYHKESAVNMYKEAQYVVGMCGDGANDCAALAAADCGVALSEAEASVVSPFSARNLSTYACVQLIKEGRACLTNSFAAFKYSIFYGITQTSQMIMAFGWNANLTQAMYMIEDFIIYLPVSLLIVRSKPSSQLKGKSPTDRIFGWSTISSLFGQLIILLLTFFVSMYWLYREDWYFPDHFEPDLEPQRPLYESTTLFLVGNFNLIFSGVAWSFGATWRQAVWKNYLLMVLILLLTVMALFLLFIEGHWDAFTDFLQLKPIPTHFQLTLFVISIIASVVQLCYEKWFVLGAALAKMKKLRSSLAFLRGQETDPSDVSYLLDRVQEA